MRKISVSGCNTYQRRKSCLCKGQTNHHVACIRQRIKLPQTMIVFTLIRRRIILLKFFQSNILHKIDVGLWRENYLLKVFNVTISCLNGRWQLELRTSDHTDSGGIVSIQIKCWMPLFLFGSNYSEHTSGNMEQRPQVIIAYSFYETGQHQHHKMGHHIRDWEVTCDHNVTVIVNPIGIVESSSTFDHFHGVSSFNRLCRGASLGLGSSQMAPSLSSVECSPFPSIIWPR